jgi:hypothetical protein
LTRRIHEFLPDLVRKLDCGYEVADAKSKAHDEVGLPVILHEVKKEWQRVGVKDRFVALEDKACCLRSASKG